MKNTHIIFKLLVLVIVVLGSSCKAKAPGGSTLIVESVTPSNSCIQPGDSIDFNVILKTEKKVSIFWTFSGGVPANSFIANPSATYPNKGFFTETVEVSIAEGSVRPKQTEQILVRVKDSCIDVDAKILSPPDNVTVAVGQPITFTGIGSGGDQPYFFEWQFFAPGEAPNGTHSIIQKLETTDFTFPETGQWTVKFLVIDTIPGNFGGDVAVDSILVNVISSALAISLSNSDGDIEQLNELVGFGITVNGGTPPYTYSWSLPGSSSPTSTDESPSVTFTTTGTKNISVEVTDSDGAKVTKAITIQVTDAVNLDVGVGTVRQITKTPADFPGSDATKGGILFFGRLGMVIADIGSNPPVLGAPQLPGQIFDLGVVATPTGAEPAAIVSSFTDGLRITRFNSTTGVFETPIALTGDTGIAARATDIHMVNEDPSADVIVTIHGEVRRFNYSIPGDTFVVGAVYEAAEFPGGSGATPRSAVTRGANSSLLVTSASDLWIHDGVDGNAANFIGTLGTAAQELDCAGEICVSCDSSEDKCSVILWDAVDNVSITDTFITGNGPLSCDLLPLNNGDVACASVCGSAICYTTAVIDSTDGTVKSSTIKTNLPSFCLSPEDVQFMDNGTTNVLFTCLDANNATIVDTGISNP